MGNDSSKTPHVKAGVDELVYFNVPNGRAEIVRILYTMYNTPFIDTRVEYGGDQWYTLKPGVPYRTLPMLKRGRLVINQNIAIVHLLAKEFGLVGDTWEEQALEEAIIYKLEEIANKGADILIFEPDPVRKEQDGKKFLETTLPTGLETLEGVIAGNEGGNGYFVGNKMKWCDIYFYCVAERFLSQNPDLLNPYPNLKTLHERIRALPGVQRWLNKPTPPK